MKPKEGQQHVILCEGFDDRSFWSGWLSYLGCTDPTDRGKKTRKDAWGRPVTGRGRYLFHTPSGSCVIIQPFDGRHNAKEAVAEILNGQAYRPDRLILNLDSDAENGAHDSARDAIRRIIEIYGGMTEKGSDGPVDLDGTRFWAVIWECGGETAPGGPRKQTLERLICAAIHAAYPNRGAGVQEWLDAPPRLETPVSKNFSYSYLAKWYAKHGADDFFRQVWRDETVSQELRRRLEATEAWKTVESLVAD